MGSEREEAEAGARPEPGERLGRAGGRRGWERGGRLASVCGSSGASAMEAEPRRGCCTDSPPTPRSGPAHLAVSRLAIGASRRDADGGRANGRRRAGDGAGLVSRPFFFFFLSFFFFFFLSNKMSRREGGERPASGDAAARAPAVALGGGRASGWAPQAGARLCAGPGPRCPPSRSR